MKKEAGNQIVSCLILYAPIPPYGSEPNASGAGQNFSDRLDDKEIASFCQFAHRMLKSGGYVFIFSSVRYLQKWISTLRESGFRAMSHVYAIIKSSERLQHHRLSSFPQNLAGFGVVARKSGSHSQQFSPDFTSPYHHFKCASSQRFSAITDVPIPIKKLTFPGKKTVVRVEEKSVDLLIEIMKTFCPEEGAVLDAYAGTLTTAIACL